MAKSAKSRAADARAEDDRFSDTASRRPVTDVRSGGGKKGPKSALEGGEGSTSDSRYGDTKRQSYSVQYHDDENGVQVAYVDAESGDEAAQKVLAKAQYKGTSIRGVTPASDPDANSMGGERDAAIMIANAEAGGEFAPVQTEANAKAVEELGKADIEELGE